MRFPVASVLSTKLKYHYQPNFRINPNIVLTKIFFRSTLMEIIIIKTENRFFACSNVGDICLLVKTRYVGEKLVLLNPDVGESSSPTSRFFSPTCFTNIHLNFCLRQHTFHQHDKFFHLHTLFHQHTDFTNILHQH